MYELKFAKTYDFAIMIKNNISHVIEDAFVAEKDFFCVADGVTRERIDGKVFKYPETLEEAKDLVENYPNPSGSSKAANTCVDSFKEFVSNSDNISEKVLLDAAKYANKNIAELNRNMKIDYVQNDYFCCEAVGGVIVDNILYCFGIGDCSIQLLDDDYNVVFNTVPTTQALSVLKYKPSFILLSIYKNKWNWSNAKMEDL